MQFQPVEFQQLEALPSSNSPQSSLLDILAARNAALTEASSQQVKLAEMVGRQAQELAILQEQLLDANRTMKTRLVETTTLSSLVLQLEDSLSEKSMALAACETENERLRSVHAAESILRDKAHVDELALRDRAHVEELDLLDRAHVDELDRRDKARVAELNLRDKALSQRKEEYEAGKRALQRQHANELASYALVQKRLNLELERVSALHEFALATSSAARKSLEHGVQVYRTMACALVEQLGRIKAGRVWKIRSLLLRDRDDGDATASLVPRIDPMADEVDLVEASGQFDGDWYLRQYPRIAETGIAPLDHYLRLGASEGLNPGPHFDTTAYLVRYPDVRRAGMNPLTHFVKYGRGEGRSAGPLATVT